MIQRGAEVFIQLLSNVKQATIAPVIQKMVSPGTLIYTDEYSIYARITEWGAAHKRVNHGQGEYARDEDGDGFYREEREKESQRASSRWMNIDAAALAAVK